ncbi:unnamed protein product [Symbiodinium necroappetens]|uniref:Uncharacterized protein n=1 Tax=Symbiodinium necroappetens TaxID=1628268 RepID=A0A813C5R1_9DINO|nr:unnamed protein product [Symbiodinium necroappetens]
MTTRYGSGNGAGLNCMLRMHEIWRRHAPEEIDRLILELAWWGGQFRWYTRGSTRMLDATLFVRAAAAECLSALMYNGRQDHLDPDHPLWCCTPMHERRPVNLHL